MSRRNFAALASAASIRAFSNSIYGAVFSVYLYDLGASLRLLGCLGAAPPMISFFSSRFWSSLSDQLRARKPFIVAGYLTSLAILLVYIAGSADPVFYLEVSIAASILTLASGPLTAAVTSVSSRVAATLGDFRLAVMASSTAGGFISGYFVEKLGMTAAFAVGAAGSLAAALLVSLGYEEHPELKHPSFKRALREAFSLRMPRGGWLISALVATSAVRGAFMNLPCTLKMYELLSRSKPLLTASLSTAGMGAFLAAPLYGRLVEKAGELKALLASTLAYMLYLPALAVIQSPAAFVALWMVPIGILYWIASESLAARVSSQSERAFTMSTIASIRALSGSAGNLAVGFIMEEIGYDRTLALSTAVNVVCLALILASWSRLRAASARGLREL